MKEQIKTGEQGGVEQDSVEMQLEKQAKESALLRAKYELDGIKQLGYKFVVIGKDNLIKPTLDPERYPDKKRRRETQWN